MVVTNLEIMAILCSLTHHSYTLLRVNSLWALKNILYQSTAETKNAIQNHISISDLFNITLSDADELVREQGMNAIRNFACGNAILVDFQLLKLVLGRRDDKVSLQALYLLVNLATGFDHVKQQMVQDEALLEFIRMELLSPSSPHRLASLWILINLTWPEDVNSDDRVETLQLTFADIVESLCNEGGDVGERALIVSNRFKHIGDFSQSDGFVDASPSTTFDFAPASGPFHE
jgi:hypothetical protein